MGKKMLAWIGAAACVMVLFSITNGCTERFDLIVINTTDETVMVDIGLTTLLTVEPNSYTAMEKVLHGPGDYVFEFFSEDGRLLGTINILQAEPVEYRPLEKLYVLTVTETSFMTIEESIAFETAREEEFVNIAMVELESEERVKRLFDENEIALEGFRSLHRFNVEVMRKDRRQAMELLEQDAKEKGYELY